MVEKSIIIDAFKREAALLRTRLDELRVQANLAEKEAKQDLKPEIEKIEKELNKTKDALSDLMDVSAEAIEEGRKGLEGAFKELREGFDRAYYILKSDKKD